MTAGAIISLSVLCGFLMYTYIEKPLLSVRKYIQTVFNPGVSVVITSRKDS
jgi:peptidoglycan/LPS O-acetylase OafA/YrhL